MFSPSQLKLHAIFILVILMAANTIHAESIRERLRKARQKEGGGYSTRKTKEVNKRVKNKNQRGDIKFIPLTLFAGMDGDSRYGFNQKIYNKIQAKADEVALDLNEMMGEQCIYRHTDKKFFILFYNQAQAIGCSRNYLIQKVLLEKQRSEASLKREYLVEIIKLNQEGYYKRADQHYKLYSLGASQHRNTKVTLELGCGEIPGVAEGSRWPYENNKLYKRIQGYSKQPGLYKKVNFDFSKKYKFSFKFGQGISPTVKVPGYQCKEF